MNNERKTEIRCVACGITEEEAKKEGSILKKIEPFESIGIDDATISYAFINADGMYICSSCKDNFLSTISSKNAIEKMKARIDAFEDFIDSSAYLMKLENQVIAEATLKVYTRRISDVARYSPDIALMILSTTLSLFKSMINEIEKRRIEKEEDKHFTMK